MKARVRSLTPAGRELFRSYLELARNNPSVATPDVLLTSDDLAPVVGDAVVENKTFGSRAAMAEYLDKALSRLPPATLEMDDGLWAWLTLFYIDAVVPPNDKGQREVAKDFSRYLTDFNKRREYRHLLRTRFKLYRMHRDQPARARLLLHGPVNVWSDFEEQIYGVMELVRLPGALECADLLYFDPVAGEPKRGATNRKKPGTIRRLGIFIQQLDLTFDVYAMSGTEIVQMLPVEYDRFVPEALQ